VPVFGRGRPFCAHTMIVESVSRTALIPAFTSAEKAGQSLMEIPDMPGLVSLPICTMSGFAPAATRACITVAT
jgi:hypothetical protein